MKRTKMGKRAEWTGKFEVDASTGHFDFVGKDPAGAVNEWTGIFELDGETLKICYRYKNNENVTRPKEFGTDKDHVSAFFTFKRDND